MQLTSELHVHTYAVGVADIATREGSPHNVLHSSIYDVILSVLYMVLPDILFVHYFTLINLKVGLPPFMLII